MSIFICIFAPENELHTKHSDKSVEHSGNENTRELDNTLHTTEQGSGCDSRTAHAPCIPACRRPEQPLQNSGQPVYRIPASVRNKEHARSARRCREALPPGDTAGRQQGGMHCPHTATAIPLPQLHDARGIRQVRREAQERGYADRLPAILLLRLDTEGVGIHQKPTVPACHTDN